VEKSGRRHHQRGSVRRASGFVLTGNPSLIQLGKGCRPSAQNFAFRIQQPVSHPSYSFDGDMGTWLLWDLIRLARL
jgi:hypothetical protein